MTAMGHEDQFPPPGPNVGCWFGQGTLAGATCNGQDAPKPVIGDRDLVAQDALPQCDDADLAAGVEP